MKDYKPGDLVVYRKPKYSSDPGPRARDVDPSPMGEKYSYFVDKYWVVARPLAENRIEVRTRRGKLHALQLDHPHLRHAHWWEKLLLGRRFPKLSEADSSDA